MIRRLAILCLLFLTIQRAASGCSCIRPTAASGLQYADVVFRGELVEHRGRFAVFRVDEQWKGNPGQEIQVEWREGNHGDCNGFWPKFLKMGSKLLVFASRDDGIYRTSICLPTKFAADAESDLRELGPGKPPKESSDTGRRGP
jgi:hypothetical protein